MSQKPPRLEFLDSIRGLAAIAVLLSHTVRVFDWPRAVGHFVNYPFINIPFNGGEAVAMFFVLSGYLLSRPYVAAQNRGAPPRQIHVPTFYIRRFTRIWMPWFFVFCLSALAQAVVFRTWVTVPQQTDWFLAFWHTPLTLENTLLQCLFICNDAKIQLVMQDWSLGLELQVSLLLPLVILLYTLWPRLILPILAIFSALFEPTGCYFAFILGILLATYADQLVENLSPKPFFNKVGLLCGGIIYYEMPHFNEWLPAHFGYEWANGSILAHFRVETSAGCFLILLSCMSSRRIQAMLHLPLLVFLGRISYSVYLLQFVVLLCAIPPLVQLLNSRGIHHPYLMLPITFVTSVVLTVSLSALTYEWVEKPCIDLGRWLSSKIPKPVASN